MFEKRTNWKQLVAGEGKVCHICQDRAAGKVKEPKAAFGWADNYIKLLNNDITVQFRPVGNSMKPRIESGWEVTVQPVRYDSDVKVESVVLCTVGSKQYLHRVQAIKENPSGLHVYEIANQRRRINGYITIDKIHGVVTRIQP